MDGQLIIAIAGFAGGVVLGLAARLGRFCTLAAIEDALFANNRLRWRMWVLAMVVAAIAVQIMTTLGAVDVSSSIYVRNPFNPVAAIVGGVMFGIGMALVGTCGFGTLVRLGGGDLRSFLVFLVIAIAAYMAAAGPTARLRDWLFERFDLPREVVSDNRLDHWLAAITGVAPHAIAATVFGLAIAWLLRDGDFRGRLTRFAWGALVGLVIAYGWLTTGRLLQDPFNPVPVESYTFVFPLGQTLMFAMTSTGSVLTFGIGATLGVIVGAWAGALWRREFRWEASDDAREARRQIAGAFLMGTGGMYAMGCTVGQGLTGMSLLAMSSMLTLLGIWIGALAGLSVLMDGSLWGAIQGLWGRR